MILFSQTLARHSWHYTLVTWTLQIYCPCHTKRRWTGFHETEKSGFHKEWLQNASQPQASNYALAKTLHLYHHGNQKLTVANSCEAKGKVERTHLYPQTSKVKREHFGEKYDEVCTCNKSNRKSYHDNSV